MNLKCVVCKDYPRIKDPLRRYHCFPKDEEIRLRWLQAVNIEHFKKNYGVCSYHFSPSDYKGGPLRKRLRSRAVPNSASMSVIGKNSYNDHEYCIMTGPVQPLSDHAYCVMVKNAEKFEPVKPLIAINDDDCVDITNVHKSEQVKPLITINDNACVDITNANKSGPVEPLLTPIEDHAYFRIKSEPIETITIDDCDCENTQNSIQSEQIKPLTNDHAYFQITKIKSLAGAAKPLKTKKAKKPHPVKPFITMNASKPGPMKPLVIPINKHAYCIITKNDKKALDTPIEDPGYSRMTEEVNKSRPGEPLITLNATIPGPLNPLNTPNNDPAHCRVTENANKSRTVKPLITFNANKPGPVKPSITFNANKPGPVKPLITFNANKPSPVKPLIAEMGISEEQHKSGPTVMASELSNCCRPLNGLCKYDFKTEAGWKRYRTNYYKMKSLIFSAKRSVAKFKQYKRNLTALVKDLEKKNDTEAASYLEGLPVLLKQMLLRGKQKGRSYSEEIKNFAIRLHFLSSRSYEFVRSKFPDFLPSVSVVQKWSSHIPKPGDSTQEVIDAVASINYNLASEELMQSEIMGDLAQLLSFEQPDRTDKMINSIF